MGKNIRSLQLLRNTNPFNDKAAAIAGIQSGATNDGTVKLARYKEKVTSGEKEVEVIKTVFGICYNPSEDTSTGATGFSYTIYDSPQEVIAELTKRLDTLQGADTVNGSVAYSIKTAIDALDVDAVGGTGKVITTISEANGKISATATDLTAGNVAATPISGDNTIALTGETVAAQIESLAQYIGGLDYADSAATEGSYVSKVTETDGKIAVERVTLPTVEDTAVTGEYVSAVSETKGQIAVTRVALPTVEEIKSEGQAIIAVKEDKGVISATAGDIAAAHVTIADAAGHFTAGTVEAALEELYSQAGAGSKVTVEEAAGTEGSNVLKVYTIKQGGSEVGKINIPKDLVVASGSVVKGNWDGNTFTESEAGTGTALKLVIANQTAPVYINTLDLVKDHTAGHGIAISDVNEISVVVDPSSEFLSVGKDGVKVSGVKTYVGEEIAKLSGETTSSGGAHVTVKVNEEAGKITAVTVSESGIASASALTNEITARKAVDGINGDAYTAKTGANYISDAGSLFDADVKLDAAIKTNADAIAGNKTAIEAEVAARKAVDGQSGATYVANSGTIYISGASSLNDADVKLDAEINKIVSGVGLTKDGDGAYKISGHTGDGLKVTSASTVEQAIYTLDNAIAAAKKANTLTKADETVVVTSNDEGTKVRVNIATADTVTNFVGYAADGSFIKSNMFGTIDAGTY